MKAKYDAVIFDIDGTLWDATAQVAAAWTYALRDQGVRRLISPEEIRSVTGRPQSDCIKILFPDLAADQFQALFERLEKYEKAQIERKAGVLYPDVQSGLESLSAHFPLFLLSNCQTWYLQLFLQSAGLSKYFKDAVCFGDEQLPKWENILRLKEKHGLKTPVYVGDTQGDEASSQKAAVDFIFAQYGFSAYGGAPVTQFVHKAKQFSQIATWLLT